jgi:hypothetical protein
VRTSVVHSALWSEHSEEETVVSGYRSRPIRDGGGKPSLGRFRPDRRPPARLSDIGSAFLTQAERLGACDSIKESVLAREVVHPLSATTLKDLRKTLAERVGCQSAEAVEEGQPFHLNLLSDSAREAADPDWRFPSQLGAGVPLGVEEPTWTTPGIWPTKEELELEEDLDVEIPAPHSSENYASLAAHVDEVRKTFLEERALGMTEGPYTLEQLAARCLCEPEEICCGALGAKVEGEKVRTIHDGTIIEVNKHIRHNSAEKTTSPTVADALHALKVVKDDGSGDEIVAVKADVTKAHRRIKVLQKDWKYMSAKVDDEYWLNKCGTYGIASAQLYWGRMAALLVRLLYHLFPNILWAFVYVDDFLLLTRKRHLHEAIAAIIFFLAVGSPLSWKKMDIGSIMIWLGFEINCLEANARLSQSRQSAVLDLLGTLQLGTAQSKKWIEKTLGVIMWVTLIFPSLRPFMQPFYAWLHGTKVCGRPSALLRHLAGIMTDMIQTPPPPWSPPRLLEWHGASDAGADGSSATVGGWLCCGSGRTKEEVYWFVHDLHRDLEPWAFSKEKVQQRIAAIELYGTLMLLQLMTFYAHPHDKRTALLPVATDNQGNTYNILSMSARKWPNAAILMEICLLGHKTGMQPAIAHVPRDFNTWADQLTHHNYDGFHPSKRIQVDGLRNFWPLLLAATKPLAASTASGRSFK